jgi:hypothetical protein
LLWTLVYEWDIQNYSQISIPRSWSKLKLDRTFSLDLGLKGVKIAWNVTKVGVDARLPMSHPNLFSNLYSEKLVKVENRLCIFARLGLKGLENSSECHESWRAHLSTNGTSKSMLNFQYREVGQIRNSTVRFR